MSASIGKSPLETLKIFRSRSWFDKAFKSFALRIATEYAGRNEIFDGCVISKGSGTTDADQMNLVVSAGNVKLNGSLSSISAVSNKEAVKAEAASIQITVSIVPTLTANTGESELLTITSNGVDCVVRFYDSSAGGEYDTSSTAQAQLDIDLSGLDADGVAGVIRTAVLDKFGSSYSADAVSSGVFTLTAPKGSQYDFTYAEEDDIGNLAGVATNYAYSFGGLINADGSAQLDDLDSSANDYYITFIVSNTDGVGGVSGDDGDSALVHGILSDSDSYLSTKQINSALAASAGNTGNYDHSGATGWCHVAEVLFDSNALAGSEITMNRNNAVSKS